MTDLEKDKILLLAHSIGKMARELQSIKKLLKEIADASQTERIKTPDYCDICNHKGCENCVANSLDDYCVPSGYAPKDTPQTDCDTCRYGQDKHRYAHICNECGVGINNYTPQTERKSCKLELFDDDGNYIEPQTETSTNSVKLQSGVEQKQTDCNRYVITNDDGEKAYNCIGCQTDCPWK